MSVSGVLRATLEYDGGRYRGWQSQVNARTVQGELTAACREVLGADLKVNGAGRTDAGVHAFAQVASLHGTFRAPAGELGKLRQAINDRLPPDIHVLNLAPAPRTFLALGQWLAELLDPAHAVGVMAHGDIGTHDPGHFFGM